MLYILVDNEYATPWRDPQSYTFLTHANIDP